MDLHYLGCKIGEQIESLSALQAEVHHAEKLADEQKPSTNIAMDAIALLKRWIELHHVDSHSRELFLATVKYVQQHQ